MPLIPQTFHVWPTARATNAATTPPVVHDWRTDCDVFEPMGIGDWLGKRVRDAARRGLVADHAEGGGRLRLFHGGLVFTVRVQRNAVVVENVYQANPGLAEYLRRVGRPACRERWPWRRVAKAVTA